MRSKLRSSRILAFVCAISSAAVTACTGAVSGSGPESTGSDEAKVGDGGGTKPEAIGGPSVVDLGSHTTLTCDSGKAATPRTIVRRLTSREYNNTIQALFSGFSLPALTFPPESPVDGFTNNAQAQAPLSGWIERFSSNAQIVSAAAVKSLDQLLPCKPTSAASESTCARQFIAAFGKRAFRRPLRDDEQTQLSGLYDAARVQLPFADSIAATLEGMLQAPGFLYRLEIGTAKDGNLLVLDPYEQATRLSYFFTGAPPDATLLAAADAGKLASTAELEAQARRLLDDPRSHELVAHFHSEWLEFSRMDGLDKDPTFFPSFTPAMGKSMRTSAARFVERIFWNEGTVKSLFTDGQTDVDSALAPAYGVSPPAGNAMTLMKLDPSKRAGILTHAGILAGLAHRTEHAPILRGVFVLARVLCAPPPPPTKNFQAPDPSKIVNTTTRARLESAHESGTCAACHKAIDGIGFGFEHYNGMGQWRDEDNGMKVNATGAIAGTADADGSFDGALELGKKLGDSQQVAECVAKHWFKYAFAVDNTGLDDCALAPIVAKFSGAQWNMRELMVAIATSPAFRSKAAETN